MFSAPRSGVALGGVLAVAGMAGCGDHDSPAAPGEAMMARGRALTSTVVDFLNLQTGPVVIAHRGMGPNLGEDPGRPIENTVASVRRAYEEGASVVEVDLQMTADGEIVAWHDDFLDDLTCFNTLTRAQLEQVAPHIASFEAVLQTARRYNQQSPGRLGGLLTVDLKPASPLCDPHDVEGAAFVDAVIRTVRRMNATDLIYFNSMSPVILGMAAQRAPEIPRQLTLLFLQLLSKEQVEAGTGLPVTEIDKTSYGLRWAEVGRIHRLPGYDSPAQAISIAHAVGARIISLDLMLLGYLEQTSPGQGAALVQGAQGTGLKVLAGDVTTAAHWMLGAALGVHALYADNVPLAISLQPALH